MARLDDGQSALPHADRDAMRTAHQRPGVVDLAAAGRVERRAAVGGTSVRQVAAPLARPGRDQGANRRRLDRSDTQPDMAAVRTAGRTLHVRTVAYGYASKERVDLLGQFLEPGHRTRHSTCG